MNIIQIIQFNINNTNDHDAFYGRQTNEKTAKNNLFQ